MTLFIGSHISIFYKECKGGTQRGSSHTNIIVQKTIKRKFSMMKNMHSIQHQPFSSTLQAEKGAKSCFGSVAGMCLVECLIWPLEITCMTACCLSSFKQFLFQGRMFLHGKKSFQAKPFLYHQVFKFSLSHLLPLEHNCVRSGAWLRSSKNNFFIGNYAL